ncbi:MAG TPA: LuxR C-terminal-related transcriptional regulator [Thermomicrobiales bacterium]|nr:LuxR C-terminal-related transcriptional regulator [Thermomicrobiales bacterium]
MTARPSDIPDTLPVQLTSFVGREAEIAQARSLLCRTRLLTLTGPGGSGKTRLALAIADKVRGEHADGVCIVLLAAVSDPAFVAPAIATALGIRPAADRPAIDALADAIGERVLLLVMDNFEQIASAAPLVTNLLSRCHALKVVVTSRIGLHVGGEQILPVLPLALPVSGSAATLAEVADSPATRLFAERASAVNPTFRVTDDNAATVVEVCRRVDGLPLAIELAAARMGMFSPQTLVERLERRLPLLTGGARDAPIRQQTIHDTIAWSYDLLSPDEQRLFRLASVFAGGWTYDGIEAMASDSGVDILDGLTALVDHSLVSQLPQPDGSTRYGMLETIREYGQDRLNDAGELPAARSRHAEYVLTYVEQASQASITSEQSVWARRVIDDLDNIRAALRWTIETEPIEALRIASALRMFWVFNGLLREGRFWLDSALARATTSPTALRADALSVAGELACWMGDFGPSGEMLEESRRLFANIEDEDSLRYTIQSLARLAHFQGDFERADALYEEATSYHRQSGAWYAVAGATGNRGMMAMAQGDTEHATMLMNEALQMCREHEFVIQVAIWTRALGRLEIVRKDRTRAREYLVESMQIDVELSRSRIPEGLEGFAALATIEHQPERAARLYGAAHRLRVTTGFPIAFYQKASLEREVAIARASLGDLAFDEGWRQGTAMSIDEAVAFALEVTTDAASRDNPSGPRLTPRETEVLRLIVEGASDKEIAEALYISSHTAMRHVSNILNKLGLPSRTAAATYAVRNGLI